MYTFQHKLREHKFIYNTFTQIQLRKLFRCETTPLVTLTLNASHTWKVM